MTQFSAHMLKKSIPQNKSWFSKLAIVVQFSLSPKITIFGKYLVHVYFLITAPHWLCVNWSKYTSSCCQINWWSNCFLIFRTAIFGTCLVHVSVATVWLGSVPVQFQLVLEKISSNNQAGYWLKQVVQSVPVLKLLNWLWPDELGNVPLYLPSSFTTFIPL